MFVHVQLYPCPPARFLHSTLPTTGHFLQHQEFPYLPALNSGCSTVHRGGGYVHGIQVPHQRDAGVPEVFDMVVVHIRGHCVHLRSLLFILNSYLR